MIASSADNIRYNGTGRCYVAEVAGTSFEDLGEMETLNFGVAVSTEKMKSTRNAARATILEVESERDGTLTFGLRELTEENLKMALLGGSINTDNQLAGYVEQAEKTLVDDKYIDLGYLNVFLTKLSHGAVTNGPFVIGETVTGKGGATGEVGYIGASYLELYNVVGSFVSGEEVTGAGGASATLSGVEKLEDVIVTNADQTIRYVQGTDYSLDPDYGYIRELSATSTIVANAVDVSYDYEAVSRKYFHAMAASSVQKKFVFVTDKDDQGPRKRYTFHKVQINLNGDFPLIGEGAQILQCTATVLADTTQASGQEYYKLEIMPMG
ncbi:MAG: hypothetical protein RBR16_07735 [Syntrophus sp. (in: bacteria)]|jgi:hypothetical protein|nr:hypothetical protein [Syntrophus sp. (in: bacteria)]